MDDIFQRRLTNSMGCFLKAAKTHGCDDGWQERGTSNYQIMQEWGENSRLSNDEVEAMDLQI